MASQNDEEKQKESTSWSWSHPAFVFGAAAGIYLLVKKFSDNGKKKQPISAPSTPIPPPPSSASSSSSSSSLSSSPPQPVAPSVLEPTLFSSPDTRLRFLLPAGWTAAIIENTHILCLIALHPPVSTSSASIFVSLQPSQAVEESVLTDDLMDQLSAIVVAQYTSGNVKCVGTRVERDAIRATCAGIEKARRSLQYSFLDSENKGIILRQFWIDGDKIELILKGDSLASDSSNLKSVDDMLHNMDSESVKVLKQVEQSIDLLPPVGAIFDPKSGPHLELTMAEPGLKLVLPHDYTISFGHLGMDLLPRALALIPFRTCSASSSFPEGFSVSPSPLEFARNHTLIDRVAYLESNWNPLPQTPSSSSSSSGSSTPSSQFRFVTLNILTGASEYTPLDACLSSISPTERQQLFDAEGILSLERFDNAPKSLRVFKLTRSSLLRSSAASSASDSDSASPEQYPVSAITLLAYPEANYSSSANSGNRLILTITCDSNSFAFFEQSAQTILENFSAAPHSIARGLQYVDQKRGFSVGVLVGFSLARLPDWALSEDTLLLEHYPQDVEEGEEEDALGECSYSVQVLEADQIVPDVALTAQTFTGYLWKNRKDQEGFSRFLGAFEVEFKGRKAFCIGVESKDGRAEQHMICDAGPLISPSSKLPSRIVDVCVRCDSIRLKSQQVQQLLAKIFRSLELID